MHIPDPPDVSYWDASPILRDICKRKLDASYVPRLMEMGERAAREVAPLAQIADRESPRLVTHDAHGNRINRVDYHPSYREMERIAYGSGMITVNYVDPQPQARTFGFALGYLFAMGEMGLYCPLCMTDGVARVLTRHRTPEQIARVVPHLASSDRATLSLSRLYTAVALVAGIGRAIHEARWYIERRQTFGRPGIEWRLALETMRDLEAEHAGAMLLTFETIAAMQHGDDRLLRILTPI